MEFLASLLKEALERYEITLPQMEPQLVAEDFLFSDFAGRDSYGWRHTVNLKQETWFYPNLEVRGFIIEIIHWTNDGDDIIFRSGPLRKECAMKWRKKIIDAITEEALK